MATNKQLKAKQNQLDVIKWQDSELGDDKCGVYNYCVVCDKSKDYPCARAFYAHKNSKLELRVNIKLSDLALRFQALRIAKNLSVQQAAKLIGIEASTLYAYEMDKAKPSDNELRRILSVLEHSNLQ